MLRIPDAAWATILPQLKTRCPRLTAADLGEAQQRIDLLTAKIQSRHWISREAARRIVLSLLKEAGVLADA